MAESSWPIPDADPDLDRLVNDVQYEQLAAAYCSMGLIGLPTDTPLVYADSSGLQVKWRPHRQGIVGGHPWRTDASGLTTSVGANTSGETRIDLAVLQLDRSDWEVHAYIRAGTAGAGVAPAPVQNFDPTGAGTGLLELPCAEITVRDGVSTIAAADVKPVAWYLGPQPVLCTSTTRPPARPGLEITETDTGRKFRVVGSSWVLMAEDTGWVSVSPGSGWSVLPSGSIRVRRVNGIVYMILDVFKAGSQATGGASLQVAALPSGYAPSVTVFAPAHLYRVDEDLRVTVSTSGGVSVEDYATIATGRALNVCLSWPVG